MMNIEILFKGYELNGNKTLYNIAVTHANNTVKYLLRKDYGSFHFGNFDNKTGELISRYQVQGYSNSSTWSRGQAWLINGFTTTYKYTKSKYYLETAEKLANYYITRLPEDSIPPWDFDVPKDKYPYIPRDTSAAAIAAEGLFELYGHTKNETYLKTARKTIESLTSDKYRADGKPEYKIPALLVNGTIAGQLWQGRSDLSIIYADYYLLKCLKFLYN